MVSGILNPLHIAILLGVVLIVFGPSRLPELAKSVGSGIRELKGSMSGDEDKPAERPTVTAARTAEPAESVG